MNAAPQILNLTDNPPPPQSSPGPNSFPTEHSHRGKIGRLPNLVRDRLNQMLQDGVPYLTIIQDLGDHGQGLTVDNISEWKMHGGYEAWCSRQLWREEMRARLDAFTDLAAGADPAQLPLAGLQMSLAQLCEQLRDLGPGSRKDQFENNADKYLRMLNTMARLSKSFMALQQYRDTVARATALQLKRQDPNREFSQTEAQSWIDRADDLFGFKSAERLKRDFAQPGLPATSPFGNFPPDLDAGKTAVRPLENQKPEIKNSNPNPAQNCSQTVPPQNGAPANDFTQPPTPTLPPIEIPNATVQNSVEPPTPNIENSAETPTVIANQPVPGPLHQPASDDGRCAPDQAGPVRHPVHRSFSEGGSASDEGGSSKIETCYQCAAPLPPLGPDGRRPFTVCRFCGARLYPPGTTFAPCQFCGAANPLSPGGIRLTSNCHRCDNFLPPPGKRFVTLCPGCGLKLPNPTSEGTRVTDRCAGCRAVLPLLEPDTPNP